MARQTWYGNVLSSPVWAADFGGREHIMPIPAKLDATKFTDGAGIQVTVSGAAAVNATSIPVNALTLPLLPATTLVAQGDTLIPNGSVLWFGAKQFCVLTADAHYGDTALTVAAIPTAFVGGEVAVWSQYNTESVASGTPISRTYAVRDTGNTLFYPAVSTDDEIYLLLFDVVLTAKGPTVDCELYRPGSVVKENFLPNYATVLCPGYVPPAANSVTPVAAGAPSALLTKLRTLYKCIIGVN